MRSIFLNIFSLFYFLVPSGNFYCLSYYYATRDRMTAKHFSASFKSKMADETLRDGSDRGLYNFVESLLTLLICIQNLNAQDVSAEYFEQVNLRRKSCILIRKKI